MSALSFVAVSKQPSDVSKARDTDGIAVRSGKREAEPILKKLDSDLAVYCPFTFYNSREEADALAVSLVRMTPKRWQHLGLIWPNRQRPRFVQGDRPRAMDDPGSERPTRPWR